MCPESETFLEGSLKLGVSGNSASVDEFFYHVRRIHQRWLNQRSQRRSYTWAAYNELMRLLQLEQPRIVPTS